MPQAIWKDAVLADSDETVVVEGNHYFPPSAVNEDYLRPSSSQTGCWWKGTAHYYDVVVGEHVNPDAAWYYPDPTPMATVIKDHVAFWNGVRIDADDTSEMRSAS